MKLKPFLFVVSLLPLAACTPNDTTFGGALRHNLTAQVIDPDPQFAGDPMEGANGKRAGDAVKRYEAGTIKEPKTISTTTGGGGSSGSSGGN